MTYITTTAAAAAAVVTIIITLASQAVDGRSYSYEPPLIREYTRNITLKQGTLQGIVVEARINRDLDPVEQYKGIPYAAPPVGELRFMPSGSAPSWFGTKFADAFGPVCPQKFPDARTMAPGRKEHYHRLRLYLQNQSEDCLYLNIYAPYQDKVTSTRKYPVMVYIHGESFEWNSGNPYDGSVLAAYGKVIVVTLNFRLGVLGFLKAGTEEYSKSNFGLIDQIAALLWVKENIAAFGGDPGAVTLFGHGTGAVCASLLMLSPMVLQENNKLLFQRAILMGGTALSDWALAGNPREVTYQVAQALNCQIHDDFAACLRRKRLDEIMAAAAAITPAYRTRFGPVVDSLVVPNNPKKSMTTYSDIFRRFELMYGVTELESIHLLGPVALTHGMLEEERDQELRKYLRSRCEMKPELCVERTLVEYRDNSILNDETYGGYTGLEPDRASLARDGLLDILSDARTVAPIVQTAIYHAALNQQSYFYVFTHKIHSKEYLRNKSFNGEELPFVFGVPLDGPKYHYTDQYTEKEKLFSEIIMTYFTNFAYTGDPNVPRRNEFYTLNPIDWIQFDVDWPEFDSKQERYLQLGIPPHVLHHYRQKEMKFWNDILPKLSNNRTFNAAAAPKKTESPFVVPKRPPPFIITHPARKTTLIDKYENFHKPLPKETIYGTVKLKGENDPDNLMDNSGFGTVNTAPPQINKESSAMNLLIIIGFLFLIVNVALFLGIYYRCYRMRKNGQMPKNEARTETTEDEKRPKLDHEALVGGCNLIKIISQSSRSDDTYEAVKTGRSSAKYKLARQMSNSTIDAHTKVRDWITQEIVHKYSPRFLRRSRAGHKVHKQHSLDLPDSRIDSNSPTRPVSPSDNFRNGRPALFKSSSIPLKQAKPEKVSVAVDATPSGRGPSVLQQQPIELTKSLDRPNFDGTTTLTTTTNLRRSSTLEDFTKIETKTELRKSTTSINLNIRPPPVDVPTIIRIEHAHSKSEPVQDLYSSAFKGKKLKTFDPKGDINVTSRDETIQSTPLTPEESLMTIKRRKFPKVLPDYPTKETLAHKRRSMPVSSLFHTIPEGCREGACVKFPPAPPPRGASSLTRQAPPAPGGHQICQSAPMLAEEPPAVPEPELTCNNLYVGPLIPKLSSSDGSKLNMQPIYESLRAPKAGDAPAAAAFSQPARKIEPRVIIKPTISTRQGGDPRSKHIPRVVVSDNLPQPDDGRIKLKKSHIPMPVKSASASPSSSDSTPSEESDTGTVVKRIQ